MALALDPLDLLGRLGLLGLLAPATNTAFAVVFGVFVAAMVVLIVIIIVWGGAPRRRRAAGVAGAPEGVWPNQTREDQDMDMP